MTSRRDRGATDCVDTCLGTMAHGWTESGELVGVDIAPKCAENCGSRRGYTVLVVAA